MRSKLITLALSIIITGCTGDALVHRYEHTTPEGWDRKDTLCFDLPTVDKAGYYTLSLGIRTNNNLPYKNVWIVVDSKLENPTKFSKDTVNIVLTDDDGYLLGKGMRKTQTEQMVGPFMMEAGQTGQIRLYHVMTKEVIPDITDVGLMLEPVATSVDAKEDK